MSCSEWKEYSLGDICEYRKQKISIDKINVDNYISTENMLQDKKGITVASSIPNAKSMDSYLNSDVLISNIRPYFKKIWYADKIGGASNDVLIFYTLNKDVLNSKYLYYLLSSDDFFDYVMSTSKGTKMPRGDKEAIMNYKVELPPLEEQEKIVDVLSSLDHKIELNNEMNKTLDEMAQSIFKRWFVDFEFPNEDGQPYKSSGGEMIKSELGMIPKDWEVKTIADIGEVISGGTPSTKNEDYYGGNISWITPKDLSGYNRKFISKGERSITELGLQKSSAKLLPKGTVLFSSRAPIGYVAIAEQEVCTNQGFKSIVCNAEIMNNNYVYYFLKFNKENIENVSSGSTFKEISGTHMKNFKIIVPEKCILYNFNKLITSYDKLLNKSYKEIDDLTEIKNILLPKLMNGEIILNVKKFT